MGGSRQCYFTYNLSSSHAREGIVSSSQPFSYRINEITSKMQMSVMNQLSLKVLTEHTVTVSRNSLNEEGQGTFVTFIHQRGRIEDICVIHWK